MQLRNPDRTEGTYIIKDFISLFGPNSITLLSMSTAKYDRFVGALCFLLNTTHDAVKEFFKKFNFNASDLEHILLIGAPKESITPSPGSISIPLKDLLHGWYTPSSGWKLIVSENGSFIERDTPKYNAVLFFLKVDQTYYDIDGDSEWLRKQLVRIADQGLIRHQSPLYTLSPGHVDEGDSPSPNSAKNPLNEQVSSEDIERAKKVVNRFTAFEAKHVNMMRLDALTKKARRLNDWKTVLYRSDKWTGKEKGYYHPWGDGHPRTVYITEDESYVIGVGRAVIKADGINDMPPYKSKAPVSLNDARKVKIWAKLANTLGMDLPCSDCGTKLDYDRKLGWVCKKCGGPREPKYKIKGGDVLYDAKSQILISIGKIRKTHD